MVINAEQGMIARTQISLLLYKAKFTPKWVKNCQFRPKNALIDLKNQFHNIFG